MIWLVALLIPLTAFTMGAVHPWAFKLMEEAAFAGGALWMGRIALGKISLPPTGRNLYTLLGCVVLFPLVAALQLLPLPPKVERWISPNTYRLYQVSLPGWPDKTPYAWLSDETTGRTIKWDGLRSKEESNKATEIRPNPSSSRGTESSKGTNRGIAWMPLSIAPGLTTTALLKLLSYCALGLLVILYPFPDNRQWSARLYHTLVGVLLATGLCIALVGVVQQFVSNGRPLWIYVPYDWLGQQPWGARAFGPFANPDHYACYLAMVLPVALAGVIFPGMLGQVRDRTAVPLLSGAAAIVVIVALLSTGSRGGLLNAAVGTCALAWMVNRLPQEQRPTLLRHGRKSRVMLAGCALVLLSAAVYLAGPTSRNVIDTRLNDAISHDSLLTRIEHTEDTARMVADFPLLGVGLGAWPDLFKRYARPPWSPVLPNATHDEYMQLLAETGAMGFLLALAIGLIVVRRTSALFKLPIDLFAATAAFTASLAGLAVHAALDFPLRIPAIALLGVIMLAAVVRALFREGKIADNQALPGAAQRLAGGAVLIGSSVLMWIAWNQPAVPYPYDLKVPKGGEEMLAQLMTHPMNSRVHLRLLALMNYEMPGDKYEREVEAAVALAPTDPVARDLYALTLMRQQQTAEALRQISKSVLYSPSSATHFYLSNIWIPRLLPRQRNAVEQALREAIAAGYDPAVDTLADFYHALGWFEEQGALLEHTAGASNDAGEKQRLLSQAGVAFARAANYAHAENVLRQAITAQPADAVPYQYLAEDVMVPRKHFEQARATLMSGIEAGADQPALYVALADVNQAARDNHGAEQALEHAADLEPYNFQVIYRLGSMYLGDGKSDRAVVWLKKAAQLHPQAADVFFELAQAEESAYEFFAAEKDYARALALEPANAAFESRYRLFKQKVAANSRRN
jgi:tetratricopeptide (TPR) repeat protein